MPSADRPKPNLKSVDPPLEPEPWADTSSFHTKAREGTTESKTARLSQDHCRRVEVIIHSGKHPELQTFTDVMRDALYRWLLLMAETDQSEEEKAALLRQKRLWRLDAQKVKQEQWEATVETARQTLEMSRSKETRRAILKELNDLTLEMDDSDARDRALRLIEQYR